MPVFPGQSLVRSYGLLLRRHYDVCALILGFLALRLVFVLISPAVRDESYGVVVSRSNALSYFDHPSFAFGIARFFADLFGTENLFVLRMPYIVMGTISALLLYDLTRRIFSRRAGYWAVVAYSTSPFFSYVSSNLILPDGPLNMFMLAAVWLILPVLQGEARRPLLRWLLTGLMLGGALLSKYHAALLLAGMGAGLLASREGRRLLMTPGPWLGLTIALVSFAPVLIWNASNGWASFAFQMDRGFCDCIPYSPSDWSRLEIFSPFRNIGGADPVSLGVMVLFQAMFLLPTTFLVAAYCLFPSRDRTRSSAEVMLIWLAVSVIVMFNLLSLFSKIYPHWTMPGYLFFLPLVGHWCSQNITRRPNLIKGSAIAMTVVLIGFGTVVSAHARYGFLDLVVGEPFLGDDVGWDSADWEGLRRRIAAEDVDARLVLVENWREGGQIGYRLGPDTAIGAYGEDARHFLYFDPPVHEVGDRGLAVRFTKLGFGPLIALELARDLEKGGYIVTGSPEILTSMKEKTIASLTEMVVIPVTATRRAAPVPYALRRLRSPQLPTPARD